MLDLTLSWATFAEYSAPGLLGRIGPVTATQARALAAAASTAPGTRWRVILTDHHGHAIKTATMTRRLAPATQAGSQQPPAAGGPMLSLAGPHASITGRVSRHHPRHRPGPHQRRRARRDQHPRRDPPRRRQSRRQDPPAGHRRPGSRRRLRAHHRLAGLPAAADDPGPHRGRDQTCRFPGCRQPAWRGDLDHTTPFHCGGLTCPCNLGPLCRRHHRLKQQQHWTLTQTTPGTFHWQTPAGRSYTHHPTPARPLNRLSPPASAAAGGQGVLDQEHVSRANSVVTAGRVACAACRTRTGSAAAETLCPALLAGTRGHAQSDSVV